MGTLHFLICRQSLCHLPVSLDGIYETLTKI
jgi:hypothetical protein